MLFSDFCLSFFTFSKLFLLFVFYFVKILFVTNDKGGNEVKQKIEVKPFGEIRITVFKEEKTSYPFFYIESNSEDLLPLVDILEDNLKLY